VDVGQYLLEWAKNTLIALVVIAIIIGGLVWLILRLGRPMPYVPRGRCTGGTNCKILLPHGPKARPCKTCPFVKR
jgi:hypothetical protein